MTAESKSFLADKGYDIQYGARPLKRALQNFVEDEISELLLDGALQPGDTIVVDCAQGENKLRFNVKKNVTDNAE
jgi:ATP-dependent Clp protease ATP-binding subunit ClpC